MHSLTKVISNFIPKEMIKLNIKAVRARAFGNFVNKKIRITNRNSRMVIQKSIKKVCKGIFRIIRPKIGIKLRKACSKPYLSVEIAPLE